MYARALLADCKKQRLLETAINLANDFGCHVNNGDPLKIVKASSIAV
jgi:hypothetical protein